MALEPGTVFAGYRIERILGSGGMGTVYLARHPRLPRSVALKVLDLSAGADGDFRIRFEREAELAVRLDHPNVVEVYDRGQEGDRLWISMRRVDGSDVSDLIRRGRAELPPRRAVDIIAQAAAGLDAAHHRGLLHRDVKPANLLVAVDDEGRDQVFVTDFGIARSRDDAAVTASGVLVATLAYAAPEQISGDDLDHRADIYSLGCTLFHMLTGTVPFAGPSPAAVVSAHLFNPPPRVTAHDPSLPPALDEVIGKALAKDPADRYASCRDLAVAAQRALPPADAGRAGYSTGSQEHSPGGAGNTGQHSVGGGAAMGGPASSRAEAWSTPAAHGGAQPAGEGGGPGIHQGGIPAGPVDPPGARHDSGARTGSARRPPDSGGVAATPNTGAGSLQHVRPGHGGADPVSFTGTGPQHVPPGSWAAPPGAVPLTQSNRNQPAPQQVPAPNRHRTAWMVLAAGVGVLVIALVAAVAIRTAGGFGDRADGPPTPLTTTAATSAPPTATAPSTTTTKVVAPAWGRNGELVGLFPGLLPDTPSGRGFNGATCTGLDVLNNGGAPAVECRQDNGIHWYVWSFRAGDPRRDSTFRTNIDNDTTREEDWSRDSGTGKVRWTYYPGGNAGLLTVRFDDPGRAWIIVDVSWDHHTGQDLYDQWWSNAPI
ncbi:serine/threonine-protein kinase [Nocardia puris]|uniref:serine/threonine-protein kinase n=1 Tax=Nocardia puris TaxID=208602 RepID=UPI001E44EA4A|nr:serine/threonine-protein kinase [Nocardia puris]